MATTNSPDEIVRAPDSIELGLAKIPAAATTKDSDPFLVAFDQPYDFENPMNWPAGRKWMVTDVLSATGFNRIMVSTIMAPALTAIGSDLHMSSTEAAMSMSIYILATAFGPMVVGPLAEIYGRQIILHTSSVWFFIWNLVCGFATTKEILIASRFLAGFGASSIYALAGGVLSDIWTPEQRGSSLGVYLLIPLLASAVGPIIGGFIAVHTTWRWMFWSTSIFQAGMLLVSFFSFHESSGALILRRRVERLRRETGNSQYYTASERFDDNRSAVSVIARAMTRPVRLLVFHPIIQVTSLLGGFNYGILYITLSTFSNLWKEQYHQSVEISGLHYIAPSIGELVGSQIGGRLIDYIYNRRKAHNHAPEVRIPLIYPSIAIALVGMLIYGWTAEYRVYWFVVDIGVFIMMFGMQLSGMPITAYVIDSYPEHTSSALAASQFVKSLMAFCFPIFSPTMYQVLGYGWGNTVVSLAGFGLSIPLLALLWRFGARWRAKAISTY